MEAEVNRTLHMFFPLVAWFINCATRLVKQGPVARFHSMYFELYISLTGYKSSDMVDD